MSAIKKTVYKDFIIQVATEEHQSYSVTITDEMASSAKARGTGIAQRSPEYISKKMLEGKAIIATTKSGEWVGFCYIETWEHGRFVANSGLIVHPDYRKSGVATAIKAKAFRLSREKYPQSNIVGLTTSMAVMKINSELGYEPVSFSELPKDDEFWKGCQTCVNYDILTRTNRAHCLCTGMKYHAKKEDRVERKDTKWEFVRESSLYEKWINMKQRILLKKDDKKKV
ncbi:MAG: GNAT family N-acetyltransferase [Cytophagales bacterium]|nr:GNAT family N-acetyltransferase [Cytophagales bacterium]